MVRICFRRARPVACLLVISIALAGCGTGGTSRLDGALSARARQVLPSLNHPGGKLPITDQNLHSFQAWVYNADAAFLRIARRERGARFEQVVMSDSLTMPPQALTLRSPHHSLVPGDAKTTARVTSTQKAEYTTVTVGSQTFRMYVTPLKTPAVLTPSHAAGLLEVIQPQ